MAKPLSADLRDRLRTAVDAGATRQAAAQRYNVVSSTVTKLVSRVRATGSTAPAAMGGDRRSGPIEAHADEILALIDARADVTLAEIAAGRRPVILTERRDHLEYFRTRLEKFTRALVVLYGGMNTTERRTSEEGLKRPDTEERLVLATGRYLGEGFDDASLDTLFLTMPISWKGTLAQYVGRLHREHHAKREVIVYDYVDSSVLLLARMAVKRQTGYRSLGYDVER